MCVCVWVCLCVCVCVHVCVYITGVNENPGMFIHPISPHYPVISTI